MLSDERIKAIAQRAGEQHRVDTSPRRFTKAVLNVLTDDDFVELVVGRGWHEGWMPADKHYPTGVQLRAFAPPIKEPEPEAEDLMGALEESLRKAKEDRKQRSAPPIKEEE